MCSDIQLTIWPHQADGSGVDPPTRGLTPSTVGMWKASGLGLPASSNPSSGGSELGRSSSRPCRRTRPTTAQGNPCSRPATAHTPVGLKQAAACQPERAPNDAARGVREHRPVIAVREALTGGRCDARDLMTARARPGLPCSGSVHGVHVIGDLAAAEVRLTDVQAVEPVEPDVIGVRCVEARRGANWRAIGR